MPKLSKPPAQPSLDDVQRLATNVHIAQLGMAVAIADLAQQMGMSVADTVTFKERIEGIGLPFPVPHHIAHAAHRIDRDRIDGMLWRCHGRKVSEPIPQVTRQQATKQVESVNQARTTGTVVAGAPDTDTTI